jgi:hypothetical protein
MAAKDKANRLESQIEKFRTESNWGKVQDLAKQLLSKQPKLGRFSIVLTPTSLSDITS